MRAENLTLSFGTNVIYDNAEFNIPSRAKCGIVGVNGAGKTTLFKIILGQITPDYGNIYTDGATIGYLPQVIEIKNPDVTVWDFIASARPVKQIESQLHDLYVALADNPDDIAVQNDINIAQEKLEILDAYNAENIMLDIIENMNLTDLIDMKMSNLSGGQKSQVAFARLLYSVADVLLLDEPTNHLDAASRAFVCDYLRHWRGSVLIISHDTEFLNEIVNKILFIDKATKKITVFDGNYDDYKSKVAQLRIRQAAKIKDEERQIKHLSEFVARANAASPTAHSMKRAGHVRAAQLEKLLARRTDALMEYKRVKMNLTPLRDGARFPIMVDDLWFRYPGKKLLYRKLSFYIASGERFLIVGENGVGKSTLLKLIMGFLTPERGVIDINPKTDIAYYAQELEQLDLNKTVLENVGGVASEYSDLQLRAALANFLFFGNDVFKTVASLSPGERARVALCKLLLRRANMLILDEPTNHLDPETQVVIGENFRDFAGTILVVSHNPDFVEQIGITRMLVLPAGRIEDYDHEKLEYYYNVNSEE